MAENENPASRTGLSRRTVVKAAAWSVPIMAIGSNAPAMAASPIFELTGAACKLPGNSQDVYKGYAFGVTATNPYNCEITVTIQTLSIDGTDLGDVLIVQTDPANANVCDAFPVNTLTIPANDSLTDLVVLTENAANSQQGTLSATYLVEGDCIPGGSESSSGTAPVTPPIQGAVCDDFTQEQKDCLENFVISPA